MTASVVIPARDSAATIGRAVACVRDQRDARGRPVEVVVVDDGSVDDTGEVARRAGAHRVVRAGGDGPARARNLGVLAAATGDVIIFTDADCAARPGFVAALTAPLDDPSIGGTKGAYVTAQRSLTARFVQQEYEERYARMARRASIDFVDTYACAYRRALFEAAGGFDERYRRPSTEDQELSFRIVERGVRLVFVPDAVVEHLHVDTPWGYAKKKAKIGYYKVATLRRHPGKAVDDAHTPPGLKLQVALAPAAVALGPLGLLVASAAPLVLRCLRADPVVALVAPALVVVRAAALAAGLTAGALAELRGGVLRDARVPA